MYILYFEASKHVKGEPRTSTKYPAFLRCMYMSLKLVWIWSPFLKQRKPNHSSSQTINYLSAEGLLNVHVQHLVQICTKFTATVYALTNLKDHSSFSSYLGGNIQMGNGGCDIGPIVNVCWKERGILVISYVRKQRKTTDCLKFSNDTLINKNKNI